MIEDNWLPISGGHHGTFALADGPQVALPNTLSEKQLSHKRITPSGLFSSAADTACGRAVVDQIDSDFSQQGKIVPSMLFPDTGSILLKRDIQHPMQTVFYRPVLADSGDLPLIFDGHAGQKIPFFC